MFYKYFHSFSFTCSQHRQNGFLILGEAAKKEAVAMDPPPPFPSHCVHLEAIYLHPAVAFLLDFFQWPSIKQNQYIIYRISISLARLHIRLPILLHGTYSACCLTFFRVLFIMRLIVMTVAFLL